MKKKIMHLKPVAYADLNQEILAYLNTYKDDNTEIEIRNLAQGPLHLEYLYYQSLAEAEIIKEIIKAENDGFAAAVIACFDDPALYTAREISKDIIVTGPAEASVHLAATLGDRFSVIVGRDKWIPQMRNNIIKYGLGSKLASFRSLGLGVLDFHKDQKYTARKMKEEIKKAVEKDKAEVIILGCTMQYGFFHELQAEFNVPVIDSMVAALKYAEYLVEIKNKTGWCVSRRGMYERPAQAEMDSWGLK